MAAYVYENPEYRRFVCGDGPCSFATFREGIDVRAEVVRWQPETVAYFLEPKRTAFNLYTGFFIVHSGRIEPQLIFFGSGMGTVDRIGPTGFKTVQGTERTGAASSTIYIYDWDGSAYVEVRAEEVGEKEGG